MVQITSVFKSSIYYQCFQSHSHISVHSKVYKIPVCSKELHKLSVVPGMVYGVTKYECMGKILLHCETMKSIQINYIYGNKMKMENKNENECEIYVHSHLVLNTALGK